MMLADQGADVIHVDPPGGPRLTTNANATWNRNKRAIEIDLKSAEGLAMARELIAASDVLIENFRPGVMDRLGIGPERCSWRIPRWFTARCLASPPRTRDQRCPRGKARSRRRRRSTGAPSTASRAVRRCTRTSRCSLISVLADQAAGTA